MNDHLFHFYSSRERVFEVTVSCLTTEKTEYDCFKWMHNTFTSYQCSGLITTCQDIKHNTIFSIPAAFNFFMLIFPSLLSFSYSHTHKTLKHTKHRKQPSKL